MKILLQECYDIVAAISDYGFESWFYSVVNGYNQRGEAVPSLLDIDNALYFRIMPRFRAAEKEKEYAALRATITGFGTAVSVPMDDVFTLLCKSGCAEFKDRYSKDFYAAVSRGEKTIEVDAGLLRYAKAYMEKYQAELNAPQ